MFAPYIHRIARVRAAAIVMAAAGMLFLLSLVPQSWGCAIKTRLVYTSEMARQLRFLKLTPEQDKRLRELGSNPQPTPRSACERVSFGSITPVGAFRS